MRIFSHGKIKISVRLFNILCNWPINPLVQIQYTFCISVWNFWLQMTDAKPNCMVCSVWKQNFLLIHRTELKGYEHIANSVTVVINTCLFFYLLLSPLGRTDQIIYPGNGIQITSKQDFYVIVGLSYFCYCRSSLLRNNIAVYELSVFPVIFQKNCQQKIWWICNENYI